jgi:hypothetical protein
VNLLFRMNDVQVAFGILTHCFVQWLSYLLQCTPPSSTFIKSLTSFDSSLLQVFGHLLGPRSFNNPKGSLAHKQSSFPMTFNGIELILTTTIALVANLGNWVLVISVIAIRFMVDQRPFLLETLAQVNNNTFPFHQHLKVTCDFLSALFCTCPFLFEQFTSNKWFDFKIPSRGVCTIIPFPTCSLMGYLKPIMPKFYHVLAQGWVLRL